MDHVLRDDLHWLLVKERIIFKVGVFGYKAIHGLAPLYLKELFVSVSSVPTFSRNRSANREEFIVPPAQGTPLTINEVLQWRDLPGGTTSLWKSATPVPCKTFCSRRKTFLFREAYNISAS